MFHSNLGARIDEFMYRATARIRAWFWFNVSKYVSRTELIESAQNIYERYEFVFNSIVVVYFAAELVFDERIVRAAETYVQYLHIIGISYLVLLALFRVLISRSPVGGRQWLAARRRRRLVGYIRSLVVDRAISTELVNLGSTCQFATDEGIIDRISRINAEAFAGSAFSMKRDDLYRRNLDIQQSNERAFMIIFDPVFLNQMDLGFTAVLPLSESGYLDYMSGRVKDAKIASRDICELNESPKALLLFAVGLRENLASHDVGESTRIECLLSHLAYHVVELAKAATAYPDVPIIMQTEHRWAIRLAAQWRFSDTEKVSADGFHIWEANLRDFETPPIVMPILVE